MELPFEPVTADDGRIYERKAILTHINNNRGDLKSPVTNEPMGPRLVPSYQIKNLIERMIDNGEIDEEHSSAWKKWKKKRANKQKFDKLLSKAVGGDADAMYKLARCYDDGVGVIRDFEKAKEWFKKGSDAGSIKAMAIHGYLLSLLSDERYTQNEGITLLGLAAGEGSDFACLVLGTYYAHGSFGLPVNEAQAIRLLRKGLGGTCLHKHDDDFSFLFFPLKNARWNWKYWKHLVEWRIDQHFHFCHAFSFELKGKIAGSATKQTTIQESTFF